jgi:hypothetical protein
VGRERTVSREECPATSTGHSPCLREVNVPDGRRSPLPSPDTVVCQKAAGMQVLDDGSHVQLAPAKRFHQAVAQLIQPERLPRLTEDMAEVLA